MLRGVFTVKWLKSQWLIILGIEHRFPLHRIGAHNPHFLKFLPMEKCLQLIFHLPHLLSMTIETTIIFCSSCLEWWGVSSPSPSFSLSSLHVYLPGDWMKKIRIDLSWCKPIIWMKLVLLCQSTLIFAWVVDLGCRVSWKLHPGFCPCLLWPSNLSFK